MKSHRIRAVWASVVVVAWLNGCGGAAEDQGGSWGRQRALEISAASVQPTDATAPTCANCAFGPITLSRGRGAPEVNTFQIQGDPIADYGIELNATGPRVQTPALIRFWQMNTYPEVLNEEAI